MAFSKTSPAYFNTTSVVHEGSRTGALTINTTATPIRIGTSDLQSRHTLVVFNVSADTIYVGFDNSVTVGTGLPVPANTQISFDLDKSEGKTIYGIAVAALEVRVAEVR